MRFCDGKFLLNSSPFFYFYCHSISTIFDYFFQLSHFVKGFKFNTAIINQIYSCAIIHKLIMSVNWQVTNYRLWTSTVHVLHLGRTGLIISELAICTIYLWNFLYSIITNVSVLYNRISSRLVKFR